jgi:hypothetical protein
MAGANWRTSGCRARADPAGQCHDRFWKLAPSRAWQAKSPSGLATANAELARTALVPQLAGKPSWVKLTRRGDAVSAWWSPNNRDWKWLGTREITLPHRVFVGAAVNSHHFNKLASARFTEVKVRPLPVSAAASSNATPGGGTGLRGSYFDTASSNRVSRLVPALDFHWPKGPPLPQFRKGSFTARWSGFLEARHSELHALEIVTGGGVRLWLDGRKVLDDWEAPADGAVKTVKARVWLDGRLVIDEWKPHSLRETKARVNLLAGHRYPVQIEYAAQRTRISACCGAAPARRSARSRPASSIRPHIRSMAGSRTRIATACPTLGNGCTV